MAESKWRDSYLRYKARGKILNENISNSLIAILHGMKIFCLHICVEKNGIYTVQYALGAQSMK